MAGARCDRPIAGEVPPRLVERLARQAIQREPVPEWLAYCRSTRSSLEIHTRLPPPSAHPGDRADFMNVAMESWLG
jgi:hypothetical protein